MSFVGTQVDGVGLGARRQVPRGAPRRGAERAAPHVLAWGDRRHTSPGRYNEHPEVQNSIHDILLFCVEKGSIHMDMLMFAKRTQASMKS